MTTPLRTFDENAPLAGRRATRSDNPREDLARAKIAIRDLAAPATARSGRSVGQTLALSLGCAIAGAALVRSPALRRNAVRLAFSGLAVGARFATQRFLAERRQGRRLDR